MCVGVGVGVGVGVCLGVRVRVCVCVQVPVRARTCVRACVWACVCVFEALGIFGDPRFVATVAHAGCENRASLSLTLTSAIGGLPSFLGPNNIEIPDKPLEPRSLVALLAAKPYTPVWESRPISKHLRGLSPNVGTLFWMDSMGKQ